MSGWSERGMERAYIMDCITAKIIALEAVEKDLAAKLQLPSKGAKKTRKLALLHKDHKRKAILLRAFRTWIGTIPQAQELSTPGAQPEIEWPANGEDQPLLG